MVVEADVTFQQWNYGDPGMWETLGRWKTDCLPRIGESVRLRVDGRKKLFTVTNVIWEDIESCTVQVSFQASEAATPQGVRDGHD